MNIHSIFEYIFFSLVDLDETDGGDDEDLQTPTVKSKTKSRISSKEKSKSTTPGGDDEVSPTKTWKELYHNLLNSFDKETQGILTQKVQLNSKTGESKLGKSFAKATTLNPPIDVYDPNDYFGIPVKNFILIEFSLKIHSIFILYFIYYLIIYLNIDSIFIQY